MDETIISIVSHETFSFLLEFNILSRRRVESLSIHCLFALVFCFILLCFLSEYNIPKRLPQNSFFPFFLSILFLPFSLAFFSTFVASIIVFFYSSKEKWNL